MTLRNDTFKTFTDSSYFRDISRGDAESLLKDGKVKIILRPSSIEGCAVITYKASDNIFHQLVTPCKSKNKSGFIHLCNYTSKELTLPLKLDDAIYQITELLKPVEENTFYRANSNFGKVVAEFEEKDKDSEPFVIVSANSKQFLVAKGMAEYRQKEDLNLKPYALLFVVKDEHSTKTYASARDKTNSLEMDLDFTETVFKYEDRTKLKNGRTLYREFFFVRDNKTYNTFQDAVKAQNATHLYDLVRSKYNEVYSFIGPREKDFLIKSSSALFQDKKPEQSQQGSTKKEEKQNTNTGP